MRNQRRLLRHDLAALAYRVQKAVRGASADFGSYRVRPDVRNPMELVRHMTSVLGYAGTFLEGGSYHPEPLETLEDELVRFHEVLESLSRHIRSSTLDRISPERLLQGPLADAMTHVGQLALLRRLHNEPVPPENFIMADIQMDNVSASQSEPQAPDEEWTTPAGPQEG